MGAFNSIFTSEICPRCNKKSEFEYEVKFGFCWQYEYKIGDKYEFLGNKKSKILQNGNLIGDAYTECIFCKKDFFAKTLISEGIIKKIEVDHLVLPYISSDDNFYRKSEMYLENLKKFDNTFIVETITEDNVYFSLKGFFEKEIGKLNINKIIMITNDFKEEIFEIIKVEICSRYNNKITIKTNNYNFEDLIKFSLRSGVFYS